MNAKAETMIVSYVNPTVRVVGTIWADDGKGQGVSVAMEKYSEKTDKWWAKQSFSSSDLAVLNAMQAKLLGMVIENNIDHGKKAPSASPVRVSAPSYGNLPPVSPVTQFVDDEIPF